MDDPTKLIGMTPGEISGTVVVALGAFKIIEILLVNRLEILRPKADINGVRNVIQDGFNRVEEILRKHDRRIMSLEVEHKAFHKNILNPDSEER